MRMRIPWWMVLPVLVAHVVTLGGSTCRAQELASHVSVVTNLSTWSYTLHNDEVVGGAWITSFSLEVNAPVLVTGTPSGWNVDTDGRTFVFWYNADVAPPYPNDVAPGSTLDGFVIESLAATDSQPLAFGLAGWNHTADEPGPTVQGIVQAPTIRAVAVVPETGTWIVLPSGLAAVLLGQYRPKRRRNTT